MARVRFTARSLASSRAATTHAHVPVLVVLLAMVSSAERVTKLESIDHTHQSTWQRVDVTLTHTKLGAR